MSKLSDQITKTSLSFPVFVPRTRVGKILSFRIAGGNDLAIFTGFRLHFASVAQLGEQRFCKPQVVGSNPSAGFQYRSKVFLINDLGGIPKRSNGTDCKSVGYAFAGSNPAPPTWSKKEKRVAKRLNGNGRFRIFKGGFQKQVFLCGDSYWSIGMVYVVSPSSQIFMQECKNLVGCPLGFFRNLLH